jgi:hypothetical protein
MITEKDRILALVLIASGGPIEGQQEEFGWTDAQVKYGNAILRQMACRIREGMHNKIPDSLVKMALAGDLTP